MKKLLKFERKPFLLSLQNNFVPVYHCKKSKKDLYLRMGAEFFTYEFKGTYSIKSFQSKSKKMILPSINEIIKEKEKNGILTKWRLETEPGNNLFHCSPNVERLLMVEIKKNGKNGEKIYLPPWPYAVYIKP